jgi:type II secretory pathway component PulM
MNVLNDFLARTNARERLILVTGGFGGVILLVWALVLTPLMGEVDDLERLAERKHKSAAELSQLLTDYQAQAARMGNAARTKSSKGFSLLSFLEGLSDKSHVKGNIKYMRPTTTDVAEGIREHSVEIKVANISLGAMVELITAVERAPHALRVKRLHIKRRFSNASLLDVTFVVSRYEDIT